MSKDPPRYEPGRGGPTTSEPPNPRHTETQSQPNSPGRSDQAPGHNKQSQKSQIAQYFRSQGRQPDDVILEIGGMQLRLKDLDG